MAGSNSYGNYRHQADACHAYQIAKKNGVPESNIILLAYDDIANNEQNPFKGKIFNKPDGPDVYEGCNISYKGAQVLGKHLVAGEITLARRQYSSPRIPQDASWNLVGVAL